MNCRKINIIVSSMSYLLTFTLQSRLSHISNCSLLLILCDNLDCNIIVVLEICTKGQAAL